MGLLQQELLKVGPPRREHRKIVQLQSALLTNEGPRFEKQRLKGARAKGRAYEKRIVKKLTAWGLERELTVYAGQWITFIDKNGKGWAQPDIFLVGENEIILGECKLTQQDGAEDQCLRLYVPLLEKLFSRPVISVQIFKNIRYVARNTVEDIVEVLGRAGGTYWQWHCLGD